MQADFDEFKQFDFPQSNVHLWVFKKSSTPSKFNAYFVRTDAQLSNTLKNLASAERDRLTEYSEYTYLAEVNESSCLGMEVIGTNFEKLKIQVDRPEPENLIRGIKDLNNAEGYVVKFIHLNTSIYAVKRSTTTWKTSYPRKFINMVFRDGELATAEDKSFSIEKNFDFFSVNDSMFITKKRSFESIMEYRDGFTVAFSALQQNPNFSALFKDLQPLVQYVGTNAIQLRRMAAIEKKGIYADPAFLLNFQRVSTNRGWRINFDLVTNQIVPCPQTVQQIIEVLLDHHLMSEVTQYTYLVPDATRS